MYRKSTPRTRRAAASGIVIASVIVFGTSISVAQNPEPGIYGVWSGTYTSTSSPTPTKEILMFETLRNSQIVGACLSASGSTGTVAGPAANKLTVWTPSCSSAFDQILTIWARRRNPTTGVNT